MIRHPLFTPIVCGLLLAITPLTFAETPAEETTDQKVKTSVETQQETLKIQLAILLDTSGSMDGLINQARTQLWKIVNQLAIAERNGQSPTLEVALYEYGKQSIPVSEGYLRQIVPLTEDLDTISEELFALKTNGGDEWAGWVIKSAVESLQWSNNDADLRLIYICGNEGFKQGNIAPSDSIQRAKEKGIVVNTIFCGAQKQGIAIGWEEGALAGGGSYLSIDQNQAVATVKTPFDEELAKLSGQINKTFLFYGKEADRKAVANRQMAQDKLAEEAAPSAAAGRASFKASGKYKTAGKDLVADYENEKADVKTVPKEELPEELQKMTPEEREAHVKKLAAEREALQKKIKELTEKRKKFIADARKAEAEKEGNSLDDAIIKSIQTQAKKKNYEFKP